MDARPKMPSRWRCTASPIFVDHRVLEKSRRIDLSGNRRGQGETVKWTEILENLSPDDFGKYKMLDGMMKRFSAIGARCWPTFC
jgi:hypothetical protein